MSIKESNPKDKVGALKVALSYIPLPSLLAVALGMMEGGFKYGRSNYRVVGVRGSVYFDATIRHLFAWWEGENFDPESKVGLHHIDKAIASLTVMSDAIKRGNWVDDRPPKSKDGWINEYNEKAKELVAAFPNPVAPYTQVDMSWVDASTPPPKMPQASVAKPPTPASVHDLIVGITPDVPAETPVAPVE